MRKLAALALLCSSCTLISPPAQKQPAAATAAASPHGLTIEEDAQILVHIDVERDEAETVAKSGARG